MSVTTSVDYRETLVTYLRSESVEQAATNLNISKATLKSRLATLKKAGVKVPKIQRKNGLGALEVARLNSIVNKYLKDTQ
jgi:predicted ArsR family transcriptional regulator